MRQADLLCEKNKHATNGWQQIQPIFQKRNHAGIAPRTHLCYTISVNKKRGFSGMTLGEKIAENRRARGMTQEEVANLLGVTSQAVSKWENNNSHS